MFQGCTPGNFLQGKSHGRSQIERKKLTLESAKLTRELCSNNHISSKDVSHYQYRYIALNLG